MQSLLVRRLGSSGEDRPRILTACDVCYGRGLHRGQWEPGTGGASLSLKEDTVVPFTSEKG